jgi:hypothetical protein
VIQDELDVVDGGAVGHLSLFRESLGKTGGLA